MKALFFAFTLLVSGIAAAGSQLKGGDTSMFVHPHLPGVSQEVYVMYVENGMARIRGVERTNNDLIHEAWLATVPVESLAQHVVSNGAFVQGDHVCLSQKVKSFSKNFCSKIHILFDNGYALLWKGLFSSDILVKISDIKMNPKKEKENIANRANKLRENTAGF